MKKTGDTNEKEIILSLSNKGWLAYHHHEKRHHKLYDLFEKYFGEESESFLNSFAENLSKFLEFLNIVRKIEDFKVK